MCAKAGAADCGELEELLGLRLRDAQRASGAPRGRIEAGMLSRGIRPARRAGRTRNDTVGLVGEMLCEELLPRLGIGAPFHVKWRESGSSLTRGVDLVFGKGDRLCACESKHLHSSSSSRAAAAAVSSTVNRALDANTDAHTAAYIGLLLKKEAVHGSACDARGDKRGSRGSAARASLLRSVIEHQRYDMGVGVVFDGARSPRAADIDARLHTADSDRFSRPVVVFAVGVECLYEATKSMIGREADP